MAGTAPNFQYILAFKIELVVPRNAIAAGFEVNALNQPRGVSQSAKLRPAVHEGSNIETSDFAIAENGVDGAWTGRLD